MLNTHIMVDDFECMWKIQDEKLHEYLTSNILCGSIIFNDGHGYGLLEHPIGCFGVYVLQYYCRLEVVDKYYLKHMTTISLKRTFIMVKRDPMPDVIENSVKNDIIETW
jgi:hypothetical protein